MEIKVNEQAKKFHLAFTDKWTPVVGHEIQIGKYRFAAVATSNAINISEVTSGTKIYNVPVNPGIMAVTETKDGTMMFYRTFIGEHLKKIIIKNSKKLDKVILETKEKAVSHLGEMPPIEDVDEDMILANTGDNVH